MCFGKTVVLTLTFFQHTCAQALQDILVLRTQTPSIKHCPFILHISFEVKECLFQTTCKFRQPIQRKVSNLSLSFEEGRQQQMFILAQVNELLSLPQLSHQKKNRSARPTSPYNKNM